MTSEQEAQEAAEAQEEAAEEAEAQAEEQAEAEAAAADEAQELLAQVPDPNAMTGTIDTSGTSDALVSEQMETITPGMMADTGHVDELKAVVENVEGDGEESDEEDAAEEEATAEAGPDEEESA